MTKGAGVRRAHAVLHRLCSEANSRGQGPEQPKVSWFVRGSVRSRGGLQASLGELWSYPVSAPAGSGPELATGIPGPEWSWRGVLRQAESTKGSLVRRTLGCNRGNRRAPPVRFEAQPERASAGLGQGDSTFASVLEGSYRLQKSASVALFARAFFGCGRGACVAGQPELVRASAVVRRREGASRATGARSMGDTPPLAGGRGLLVHLSLPFTRLGSHVSQLVTRIRSRRASGAGRFGMTEVSEVLESRISFRRTMPGQIASGYRSGPSAVKARGSPWSFRPRHSRRSRVLFDNRDCRLSVLRICLPV